MGKGNIMANTETQTEQNVPAMAEETQTELVVLINNVADAEVNSSNKSMDFYVLAHGLYTSGGAKNAEHTFGVIEALIATSLKDGHTKAVVNRVKKINGITYSAYKHGVKIPAELSTFQNIESAVRYIEQMQKAAAQGLTIIHKKPSGNKPVKVSIVIAAMTKAVNQTYKTVCDLTGAKNLTGQHYRQYNDLLTDNISHVKHTYVTERDEESKFALLAKSLSESMETMTPTHKAQLLAILNGTAPQVANTEAEAPESEKAS